MPTTPDPVVDPSISSAPPAAFTATKLLAELERTKCDLAFVAASEPSAVRLVEAILGFDPHAPIIFLPPWDCLPYDRVPPSRQCMGRRMDALRVWLEDASHPRLLITSLDALLQRLPPASVIRDSRYRLAVGQRLEDDFVGFLRRTGYVEDSVVDEAGEFALRGEIVDVFPAGGCQPVRIALDDGSIVELSFYDPASQRTQEALAEMVLGPASEVVAAEANGETVPDMTASATQRSMIRLYGKLPSFFDLLGKARLAIPPEADKRLDSYLQFIDDARQAHLTLGKREADRSLYLSQAEWMGRVSRCSRLVVDQSGAGDVPAFRKATSAVRAFEAFVKDKISSAWKVVLAGEGPAMSRSIQRVKQSNGISAAPITNWRDAYGVAPGRLLTLPCNLKQGFLDESAKVAMIGTFDVPGKTSVIASPSAPVLPEPELQPGDLVVHEHHGIGRLVGLETIEVEGESRDAARLVYHGDASLLVPMGDFGKIWRYGSNPEAIALDRLHTDAWSKKRALVDKDIRAAARHLRKIAARRREIQAEVIEPPRSAYAKLVSRFPYAETPDQLAAIAAVRADLASGTVMNRLLCGDVGFGKTEVALRAAAAVALSGGQVIVVCPTTVLARQHHMTFARRFAGTGVEVAMLSRVIAEEEAGRIKERLTTGSIDIVIATQAILGRDISLPRLKLLIIDEEHRFGAGEKQALQELAPATHTLMMSATPIPRTLQTALIGVQDTSLLTAPPAERKPARTILTEFDGASVRVALLREHRRGGQSFFVAPQIVDLDELKTRLGPMVPELDIRVAHGKMPARAVDEIMVGFADGDGDVLLSTNIIESGLDVPRANTMFVWRPDRFGVAQLHQLRGRVGRSRRQGVFYLLAPPDAELAETTRSRLATILSNDRLGAGLSISMDDMELRGSGEIDGNKQAGHTKVIGTALYQCLLERAVSGKRSHFKATTVIKLGVSGALPADYVGDGAVRLSLYSRLLRSASREEIDELADELEDRFGDHPEAVATLLRITRARMAASAFGISAVEGGPRGLALSFAKNSAQRAQNQLLQVHLATQREGRLVFERKTASALERLAFLERLLQLDTGT